MLVVAALILAVLARDVAFLLTTTTGLDVANGWGQLAVSAMASPLYLLPLLTSLRQLWSTRSTESWKPEWFFLPHIPLWVPTVVATSIALAIFAAQWPSRSRADTHAMLLEHREEIVAIARARQLDPRLLAALIEVSQEDFTSPFRLYLEEMVTAAWLHDSKNHDLLAQSLDPSLGISQVKASTVMTALQIQANNRGEAQHWEKDYRAVRAKFGQTMTRISSPGLSRVAAPPRSTVWLPSAVEIVDQLRDPHGNLEHAAFILDVVASQWESADPAWSIRDRPDIMATLFQIGFDHSWPKANPVSNDFGDAVRREINDPWIAEHFGERSPTPF